MKVAGLEESMAGLTNLEKAKVQGGTEEGTGCQALAVQDPLSSLKSVSIATWSL